MSDAFFEIFFVPGMIHFAHLNTAQITDRHCIHKTLTYDLYDFLYRKSIAKLVRSSRGDSKAGTFQRKYRGTF